jgi:hypothetical protein
LIEIFFWGIKKSCLYYPNELCVWIGDDINDDDHRCCLVKSLRKRIYTKESFVGLVGDSHKGPLNNQGKPA